MFRIFFINLIFIFDFSLHFNIFLLFKILHDTTRGFLRPRLVFLVLHFLIFFYDFIILQFDSWSLMIIIVFSSLSIISSR